MDIILKNGIVYDPINQVNGEKRDIHIKDGKVVKRASKFKATVIDVANKIVMPGGIDIHSHYAGGKVNGGRLMRPEDSLKEIVPKTKITRSGTGFSVPSTFITGYKYAGMGYTTAMTPAMPPLMARHTHEELNDTPIIDKAAYTLFDGSWFAMNYLKNGDIAKCAAFAAWLLWATKGFVIKVVNPGGTEAWGWGKNLVSLDDEVPYFKVTPKEIIKGLVEVNELLRLPHSVHLHPNNLGKPGNYDTTLKTFDVPKGIKPNGRQVLHVTHVQFHSYGGDSWKTFESEAEEIARYANKKDHIALDVGFVTLDETTTMTADGPMEYYLHNLTHLKWINRNIELETAPGVTPFVYSKKNPVHSTQWAVGLELALMIKDPWKILLSTDHPNGGPFVRYPRLIAWLMSKRFREETIARVHPHLAKKSQLANIDREYNFHEIATITRAGQAKVLGLDKFKGHLGIGAHGDVTVYDIDPKRFNPSKDYKETEKKFSRALYTIKDGNVVVKDGEVVTTPRGRTFWVNAKVDEELQKEVAKDIDYNFKRYYSVNLANYPVQEEYLPRPEEIRIDAAHIK